MITDEKEVMAYIRKRVHELYYGIDMNCAGTTMNCLSEIMDVKLEKQTMDAALGMHGAGGFRAQCGLVEGALMFLGIYGRIKGLPEGEIPAICYHYAEEYTRLFGALTCRELRPGGFREDDPPHLCEDLTCRSIFFVWKYIRRVFG